MAGILFIISAPSGSGKSTLVSQLRTLVEGLDFSISYTTRAPRGSEEDGREYHFTTRAEFERMIAAGDFLEWAEVFGNYYGTAVSALDHAKELGKDLLLDIDVQGAVQVMKKMPEAVSIFILPPSPEMLEMRLRNRTAQRRQMSRPDPEAVIQKQTRRGAERVEADTGLQVCSGERCSGPGGDRVACDRFVRARCSRRCSGHCVELQD